MSWQRIKDALDFWDNNRQQYGGYEDDQILELADEYHAAMIRNNIGPRSFEVIYNMANDRCSGWPMIADLIKFYQEYSASPQETGTQSLQLEYAPPTVTGPAAALLGKIVSHSMAKDIPGELAEKLVDEVLQANRDGGDFSAIEQRLDEAVAALKEPTLKEQEQAARMFKTFDNQTKLRIMALPEGQRYGAIMEATK